MSKTPALRIDSRRRRRIAASPRGPKRVVYMALAANLGVAVAKLCVAWLTGSAAMLSEGAHSVVDSANEALLIYGLRRAARPPDLAHPLGHGREIYFWSFVVALLFFLLGACVSVYEGVDHLLHRRPVADFIYSYVVILLAVLFEGASLRVALKEFSEEKGDQGYIDAIRRSKDPATFTVMLEDSAAILGLAIAFGGILGAQLTGIWQLDGIASILIGLLLATVAVFLAYETKSLLIGEQAAPDLEAAVLQIADAESAVLSANGVYTIHLGPQQIVAQLSVAFEPEADAGAIEDAVERMEAGIRRERPEISALFIKPESSARWQARQKEVEAASPPSAREHASRRRAAWGRPAR